jgi:hypothetical protein
LFLLFVSKKEASHSLPLVTTGCPSGLFEQAHQKANPLVCTMVQQTLGTSEYCPHRLADCQELYYLFWSCWVSSFQGTNAGAASTCVETETREHQVVDSFICRRVKPI